MAIKRAFLIFASDEKGGMAIWLKHVAARGNDSSMSPSPSITVNLYRKHIINAKEIRIRGKTYFVLKFEGVSYSNLLEIEAKTPEPHDVLWTAQFQSRILEYLKY